MDHSHNGAQENAMTEIALALAMGFFSIMVLVMISMGTGTGIGTSAQVPVLAVAPLAVDGDKMSDAARAQPDDLILIFDGRRYLDTRMQPVDPVSVIREMPDPGRRVVLALDPALSVKDAMAARQGIAAPNLVLATLNAQWLDALSAQRGGRGGR